MDDKRYFHQLDKDTLERYKFSDVPLLKCGECGTYVMLLTKAHMRNHTPEMARTQQEYVRKHPKHGDVFFWAEANIMANRTRLKKYLKEER